MREETQKPVYITLFVIFAFVFFLLRNNVYIIDDLIYHFFDRPFALIREYYYGTWLMPVQNITMYPAYTVIPWPYQKLRFALIFEALPVDATDFDLIEPSSVWQFKDIKCK